MNNQDKKFEEIINELEELTQKYDALKVSYDAVVKERKEVGIAGNLSENNYRLLAQNSSDVIWTLDNDYHFTYVSPSIYQLRGLTPEEAICEKIQDTMTPQSQDVVNLSILKGQKDEKEKNYVPSHVEIEQYHKDGHLIWVEIYIRAMLNDQGDKVGYVGISRNITKRKLAERALKEILERFDGLITKVPVGIYIIWIRANGHMEFEYVSDRWCEIHKISRQEALDDVSLVHKFIHKDDIEHFLLLNQEAARHQKTFIWEGRFMRGDELRWFHIESIPINYYNGDIQWYGVTQDITERKRAEEKLRESEEKLRELNAQKDKFFSIIAHDLKSPFNSIMGFSELLIDQITDKNYNGIEEYAKIIAQSSQHAIDLLINLLEWSRTQIGRMEFNPENIELVELIEENVMLFDVIAGQKAITINKILPSEIAVFADKSMVGTVLRNLISNAIKFTKKGGEINISAEKRGEEIHIALNDNGIGIALGRIDKLFRIDENDTTPGTNNEKGTGLGLILCKEFVEKHGGKIYVESKEGKGSTFFFTLPNKVEPLK